MTKLRREVIIQNKQGLHARPAANFVQTANRFACEITVSKGGQVVNGKSIMGILMLGAGQGDPIQIEAIGADAQPAVEALAELVSRDEEPILKRFKPALTQERKGARAKERKS